MCKQIVLLSIDTLVELKMLFRDSVEDTVVMELLAVLPPAYKHL